MTYGNTVKDGSGYAYWLLLDSYGRQIITDNHQLVTDYNNEAGNDLEYEVPAGKEVEIMSVYVVVVASGSAGTRNYVFEIKDESDNVILKIVAPATQAASETRQYLFAPGVAYITSFIDTTFLSVPIPSLRLPAGYIIRVRDIKSVSATDALNVYIQMKMFNA